MKITTTWSRHPCLFTIAVVIALAGSSGLVDGKLHESALHSAALYSIPGSGNTWVRHLIEKVSDMYTGSAYRDDTLLQHFEREGYCGNGLIAWKVHPFSRHELFYRKGILPECNRMCQNLSEGGVCAKSPITKAVIVVRNPFHAAVAEFHRQISEVFLPSRMHVAGISREQFMASKGIRDDWKTVIRNTLAEFRLLHMEDLPCFRCQLGFDSVTVLRLESLSSQQERSQHLSDVLSFLGVTLDQQGGLETAFDEDERSRAIRRNSTGLLKRDDPILWQDGDLCEHVDRVKHVLSLYNYSIPDPLPCQL